MANDAQIIIGADTSELVAALKGAQAAVSSSVAEMKSSLGGLGESFSMLSTAFLGITAVLAGGKMFKDALNSTLAFTAEVKSISKIMGITTESASEMNIALKLIGKSSDDLTGASMKLLKQIKSNEQAINDMGLQTKDSSGHLKSMMDLTMGAIDLLKQYQEGADRDAAAMYLFGRSAQEVMELQKLNSDVMERATVIADKYHLKVGAEGVEAAKNYKMAMAELGIVWEAMCHQVGEILIPILTNLAGWFGEVGPGVMAAFKMVLESVVLAFESLWQVILLCSIDVAKIIDLFGGGMTQAIKQMEDQVVASDNRLRAMMEKPINKPKSTEEDAPGGNKKFEGFGDKNKKDPSRVGEWDAKLGEAKVFYQKENDLRSMSLDQEKAYWKDIEKTQSLTHNESIELRKKVSALDLEIMKKSVKDGQGLAKESINEYQRNATMEIDIEQEKAKGKKDRGEITAQQLIKMEQDYENQRYQIEQIAQEARIELQRNDPNQDPVALQTQLDKLLDIRQKHAKQVEQLNTAMVNQQKTEYQAMIAPIENAISTSVQGMISGTVTLQKAMQNMLQSILGSFVSAIAKMAGQWIATELVKTGASRSGSSIRQALGLEEATATVATKTVEGTAVVGVNAAEAASGAAASVAPTPFVGPALAAAAFAATMAMVLGAKSLFSASGGFDIPPGTNPLTQLHESEMVLPSHIANPLRDSLSGGGMGGGSTVNINATPMKGGFLMMHKEELAKALKSMHRDNMIKFA